MSVAAVLLAAGGARRFEGATHKLLAPFRGRPLISWSVESALGAGLDDLVVVGGAFPLDDVVPSGATLVLNDRWRLGIASSLSVGIDRCRSRGHDAVVVGLADQPLVPSSAWRAVALGDHSPVVVATYGGERRNPVRLHRSIWAMLPTSGDEGARALIREHPDLVAEVACDGDPTDVDTVEDLADGERGADRTAP